MTPICHPDRLPLQMALTHLECLSELICDKRRDIEMKYKVAQLDKFFAGLNKVTFEFLESLKKETNAINMSFWLPLRCLRC